MHTHIHTPSVLSLLISSHGENALVSEALLSPSLIHSTHTHRHTNTHTQAGTQAGTHTHTHRRHVLMDYSMAFIMDKLWIFS